MRRRQGRLGLALLALGGTALAAEPTPSLAELWQRVDAAMAKAAAERAPQPPVPTAVHWRPRRLGSIDLGSPLLALAGADLDGDRHDELVALTRDEVLVLDQDAHGVAIKARLALPGERASHPPRDPVGALELRDRDGDGRPEIAARSSARAQAVVLGWQGGGLVELAHDDGFPLCGGAVELVAGQNRFQADGARLASPSPIELPARFEAAGCAAGVDRQGRAIQVAAVVDDQAGLELRCRRGAEACGDEVAADRRYERVGAAFLVADVDTDGSPELVTSGDDAPGEPDAVTVYRTSGKAPRRLFSRGFNAGVAAIAAADLAGDGAREIVVAARFDGSTQVTLWTLD